MQNKPNTHGSSCTQRTVTDKGIARYLHLLIFEAIPLTPTCPVHHDGERMTLDERFLTLSPPNYLCALHASISICKESIHTPKDPSTYSYTFKYRKSDPKISGINSTTLPRRDVTKFMETWSTLYHYIHIKPPIFQGT